MNLLIAMMLYCQNTKQDYRPIGIENVKKCTKNAVKLYKSNAPKHVQNGSDIIFFEFINGKQ